MLGCVKDNLSFNERSQQFFKKKFDEKLYKKHDNPAKKAVKEFLEKKKFNVEEHPFGKFDIDLRVFKGNKSSLLEVENRPCWVSGAFPYNTVHIPWRKSCYMKKHQKCSYVIVSENFKFFGFLVNANKYLVEENSIEIVNKFSCGEQEPFFNIDRDYFIWC